MTDEPEKYLHDHRSDDSVSRQDECWPEDDPPPTPHNTDPSIRPALAIWRWEKRTGCKYPWPEETDAQALARRINAKRKWARELTLEGADFPSEWVSPEEAAELDAIRRRVDLQRRGIDSEKGGAD